MPLVTPTLAEVAHSTTLSVATQHYLREIYKLGAAGERVSTTDVARRMGLAGFGEHDGEAARGAGLVEHAPYRGVTLTADGRRSRSR